MMRTLRSSAAAILALPYRLRFGSLGRRPRLFPPLLLSGSGRIRVGNNAWIESFVAISAGREGRIEIGSTCELRSFARLEANEGHITLGDSCSVNPFCLLDGFGGLTIGNDVRIASNSVLLSSSHCYDDVDVSIHSQGAERRPTVIEDDVWIGAHVVVTGGVRIGAHSIIGAGAIVLKDIPPYSVAAGVPARVVRSRTG